MVNVPIEYRNAYTLLVCYHVWEGRYMCTATTYRRVGGVSAKLVTALCTTPPPTMG